MQRQFSPEKPNAVWCSDITYIRTRLSGFVYLTCVMDLYSRKIIAWKLSKTLEVTEVLECIEMAKTVRHIDQPLIIHTDRGIHYTCELYQQMTRGMKRSYSQKGTPYDNACIESFHSLIKREWLGRCEIQNYRHASVSCGNTSKAGTTRSGSTVIANTNRPMTMKWNGTSKNVRSSVKREKILKHSLQRAFP